ncbi:alpha-amylase [bacterium]|nr:alpha-amylase [candidate division CSSED10-310 bacterium]
MNKKTTPFHELTLRRTAIDRYALQSLFDFHSITDYAQRMRWALAASQNINTVRAGGHDGLPPVEAGKIHAVMMLSEAYSRIMDAYVNTRVPDLFETTVHHLSVTMGSGLMHVQSTFLDCFPTRSVYNRSEGTGEYLSRSTAGVPHSVCLVPRMIVSSLHQLNPALETLRDLFDVAEIRSRCAWDHFWESLEDTWRAFPPYGPDNENLLDMLMRPARETPDSIEGQLRYIASRWKPYVGEDFVQLLLQGADALREESRPGFGGPGPCHIPEYAIAGIDPEAYSPDIDWMPDVVLLAKNAYVWLEQLSRHYAMPIRTLDTVPEEALEQIARRGFNALWLIGIWARSPASRRIKQLCGNPEAAGSAYSIQDYRIDDDLGGEAAFDELKKRAMKYGIRMAGDMVPNHMGIDSFWVCQNPGWFIASETNPFPHYSYSGEDLSPDPKCSIYLEDHYYNRSDAAVTFKYVDHWNGEIRYIYHGNDGTGLPWNDTAQLNFLLPDVRNQVIDTILQVARRFPIIRFDAAMTLTRKHYHRLWFPAPGEGGDIPSRSWFGLDRSRFDENMPTEFWREVVDRVASEATDTLLLAEAFWLMEGYFVRSLGMHRVYNSAFMNMLRNEDNQNYRLVIKNTIEFDPEILKRYVNFMNNPDEEPAVVQFGKGDKYFGVCAMMSTLPGLPMFGHGQFEGFFEKYGMEYRRSYWNEVEDAGLIRHHERVITPLLRRRRVFSGAVHFRLFDVYRPDGTVDENVFVYSNRQLDDCGLVVFNNGPCDARGKIWMSAAWNAGAPGEVMLIRESLVEALGLSGHEDRYIRMRDYMTGLWYVFRSRSWRDDGFFLKLHPYECRVFMDLEEVGESPSFSYARIAEYLQGGGSRDLESTWLDIEYQPVHDAFRDLMNDPIGSGLYKMWDPLPAMDRNCPVAMTDQTDEAGSSDPVIDLDAFACLLEAPCRRFAEFVDIHGCLSVERLIECIMDEIETRLPAAVAFRQRYPDGTRVAMLWMGVIRRAIGKRASATRLIAIKRARLWRVLEDNLIGSGMDPVIARAAARLTETVSGSPRRSRSRNALIQLIASRDGRIITQVNQFRGTEYINREALEEFLYFVSVWEWMTEREVVYVLQEAHRKDYRFQEFLDALAPAE